MIVPTPQHYEEGTGRFCLGPVVRVAIQDPSLAPLVELCRRDLMIISQGLVKDVTVVTDPQADADLILGLNPSLQEESYTLNVEKRVTICGGSYLGVSWGLASMLQLLRVHHLTCTLPICDIFDAPAFPYRGVMIDVARHPFQLGTLQQLVQLCWFYKIRYLQIHLTDTEAFTFPVQSYPNLASKHNHLPRTAWETLERTAAERGVIIIPEIDVPGHVCPKLRGHCPTEPPTGYPVINPVREQTFDVMREIVREICEIFPRSPYVHIGSDEVDYNGWQSCSMCADYLATHGLTSPQDLLGVFITRMQALIAEQGKRTIIWENPAVIGRIPLPPDLIVQFFDVEYAQPEEAIERGHDIINSSWGPLYVVPSYGSATLEMIYHWHPGTFGGNALSGVPDSLDHVPPYGTIQAVEEIYSNPLPGKVYPRVKVIPETPHLLGAMMCGWELLDREAVSSLRRRVAIMSERSWQPYEPSRTYPELLQDVESHDYRLEGLLLATLRDHKLTLPEYGLARPGHSAFVQSFDVSAVLPHEQGSPIPYPAIAIIDAMRAQTFSGHFADRHAEFLQAGSGLTYYRTHVQCPNAVKLNLLLGYDGPVQVWVDRTPVFDDPHGANPARVDEIAIPLELTAGIHEIMIALDTDGGRAWGIFLRYQLLPSEEQPMQPAFLPAGMTPIISD